MEPQLPQVCHLVDLSIETIESMCVMSIVVTEWFIVGAFGMVIIGIIILRNSLATQINFS
jgi:hypothetical protein